MRIAHSAKKHKPTFR